MPGSKKSAAGCGTIRKKTITKRTTPTEKPDIQSATIPEPESRFRNPSQAKRKAKWQRN